MKNNVIETAMKKLKQLILLCIFGCVPALWAGEAPIKEESTNPAPDDLYEVRLESIDFQNRDWVVEETDGDRLNLYAVIRIGEEERETERVKALSALFQKNNAVHLYNPRNGRESFTVTCLNENWWKDKVLFTVTVKGGDLLAHKNRELVYSVDKRGRATIFSEDTDEDKVVCLVTFSVVAHPIPVGNMWLQEFLRELFRFGQNSKEDIPEENK